MIARTSKSHPLQIAEVRATPEKGRIGITFCPGKKDPFAVTGAWARDLDTDVEAIAGWGAKLVVSLIEPHELITLKVQDLGPTIERKGMKWLHLPIPDYSVPGEAFEQSWHTRGDEIRHLLRNGESILLHCKGGLGRAGMIAARLLVELGMDAEDAIHKVRRVRPGAIETPSQLALIRNTQPLLCCY